MTEIIGDKREQLLQGLAYTADQYEKLLEILEAANPDLPTGWKFEMSPDTARAYAESKTYPPVMSDTTVLLKLADRFNLMRLRYAALIYSLMPARICSKHPNVGCVCLQGKLEGE